MKARIRAHKTKKFIREKARSEWLHLADHNVQDGYLTLIIKFNPPDNWKNNTNRGDSEEAVFAHNINRNSNLRYKVKAGTCNINGSKIHGAQEKKYIKLTFRKPIQVEDDKNKIAAKAAEEFLSFCNLLDGVDPVQTAVENKSFSPSNPSLGDNPIPPDFSEQSFSEVQQEQQTDAMTDKQEVKESEIESDTSLDFTAIDKDIADFLLKEINLTPTSKISEISIVNEFNKRPAEADPQQSASNQKRSKHNP